MTSISQKNHDSLLDEFQHALRTARELDPECREDAVQRFVQEIADADAALREVNVDGVPLPVGYSPVWPAGSR